MRPILVIAFLSILFYEVSMLKISSLTIPEQVVRGQSVRLECNYDLEGEVLYSVRWYKNDHEFYRFLPNLDPPARLFSLRGITVDSTRSSDNVLILKSVDLDASGVYKCEVAGDAPNFNTLAMSSRMVVVDDKLGPKKEAATNSSAGDSSMCLSLLVGIVLLLVAI